MQAWAEHRGWESEWETLDNLSGGGQAIAKRVMHRHSGQVAFLKILNRQKDPERRARFFREATAYATCQHKSMPRLLQSNAHNLADNHYNLFIVTEFIRGQTLREMIEGTGAFDYKTAMKATMALLELAEYIHREDWVHRDIKPENILLRENDPCDPVLVDFGLAFKSDVGVDFQTEHGQEIGNRFLRLAELSAGSPLKQDVRSDLAFVGGALYYMLTGIQPSTLMDGEGLMPHQREPAVRTLKTCSDRKFISLMGFFDHTFGHKLSSRFASALEMSTALSQIWLSPLQPEEASVSTDNDLEEIIGNLRSPANQKLMNLKFLYDTALREIKSTHSDILGKVSPEYNIYWTGYVNFADGLRHDLGFHHFSTHDRRFIVKFHIYAAGDELVVSADGNVIYRTEVDDPTFTKAFSETVRKLFVVGLKALAEVPLV